MNSPITKLPDGSAFWTADVMSKEEAMALPFEKRPLCFRISSKIYTAVFEAIGAASMCWTEPSVGEFDSGRASKIATDLCFKIADELKGYVRERDVQPLMEAIKLFVEWCKTPERAVTPEVIESQHEALAHWDAMKKGK